MKKQLPRTNWEIVIKEPDKPEVTLKRRLTVNSHLDWVDRLILAHDFYTRIYTYAITDTGDRRLIMSL